MTLDTGKKLNFIRLTAIDLSWKMAIIYTTPQKLRSALHASLQIVGSVQLAIQIIQRAAKTSPLAAENLAIDVLLGTAFISANV